MEDRDALVVLNAIPGVGPARIKALVGHFVSPVSVLGASFEQIAASGAVTLDVATNIVHFPKDKFLIREYNLVQRRDVRVITVLDEGFPEVLRNIPGAPVLLYVCGDSALLHTASIAMVGSRIASHYGLSVAGRFAAAFARAGVTVVSGLARGIDTASHRGCLEAVGKTIAVIGCGFEYTYPKENRSLTQEICKKGVVVSEMPMGTPPIPVNFPRRNRIITGLSLATVVIEAGAKSGALISADFALEQGRDVFAVPADIDHTTAQGSNKLIKDGAKVALSPEDVLEGFKEQLHLEFPESSGQDAPKVPLSEVEARFYGHLTLDPVHIDDLTLAAKCAPGETAEVMLNLELKGIIRQLPGKHYVRI